MESNKQPTELVDVRRGNKHAASIEDMIWKGLSTPSEPFRNDPSHLLRSIPTLVLYDNKGLELFDEITHIPEYYLTNAEIDVFAKHATEIVSYVAPVGGVMVELGCGSMRKTRFILEELVRQGRQDLTYYALDLEEQSLRECVAEMQAAFRSIRFVGLLGTYEDALPYLRDHINAPHGKLLLWLGSSIGNFTHVGAGEFLQKVADVAMDSGDLFLIGMDQRNPKPVIDAAYNDSHGVTREFILNGLSHVNNIFKRNVVNRDLFEYDAGYNAEIGRHEAYYRAIQAHTIDMGERGTVDIQEGERIWVEYSYKYSLSQVSRLAKIARLASLGRWQDSARQYSVYLFQKPSFFFEAPKQAEVKIEEWEELWKGWDTVSLSMVADHSAQPISLRHPFIFYVGHIPTFLDVQLSRVLQIPPTEPTSYATIFERGIDPDMEDPSQCHEHSAVPETWPELEEVLKYRDAVRERVRKILKQEKPLPVRAHRVLFMCYEHEAMHLETLLYMLTQDPNVKRPVGVGIPVIFGSPGQSWLPPITGVTVPQGTVELGLSDHEDLDFKKAEIPPQFGWDIEWGSREISVPSFVLDERFVSVGEYLVFLVSQKYASDLIPASWTPVTSEELAEPIFTLKTVFGPLELVGRVLDMPVAVSGEQASRYAAHQGKRLPTEAELALVRSRSNDEGHNVGFLHWLPQPMQAPSKDSCAITVGSDLWEWTSSLLEPLPGYSPSALYPGYSADFLDGKHSVVLGASWATVPRIAARKSFRNWYQTGYPYVFAGFRCADSA